MRDRTIGIVALGLSGVAAYLFLAVAGRALGAAEFASVGALWAVVFLATAALAAPLEIAVARDVGTARANGHGVSTSARAGLVIGAILGATAVALAVAGGGVLDDSMFGGQAGFAIAGALAFAGLVIGAAAKGACAGSERLAGWGGYSLLDGGSRLALGIAAAQVAPVPWAFVLAIAVGPWIALAAPAIALGRDMVAGAAHRDIRTEIGSLARTTAPLLVAAIAAATLTYMGAVMLPALVSGADARVGAWIAALTLARLPVFVLSPVVAIAVPQIAFALASADVGAARRAGALLVGAATAGAAAVVVVAAAAGGTSLMSLFGKDFSLREASIATIGVAAACWLFATAAAAVAIGAGRGRLAAAAWCAGLAAGIAAAAAVGPDPFDRTDAAVLVGAVAAAIAAGLAALRALSSPGRPAPVGL